MRVRSVLVAALLGAAAAVLPMGGAQAATRSVDFAGTVTSTMSVNNGTNTGSIPAGTAYTGTLVYDDAQAPAPVAFNGGTKTVYSFTDLTFTVGASTAHSGPGRIEVYDNLTSTVGYPSGDSVYVNFSGVAPSGLLAGADFNWMGLAFLDSTGQAVSNGALPATFDAAPFKQMFSEFNYGTRGTRWGAGNTSVIQSLSTFGGKTVNSGTTPPPVPPVAFQPGALPDGTVGSAYSATFAAATGGTGSFTYRATGLPDGLALSGRTVSGTPTVAGTFPVDFTATDGAGTSVTTTTSITVFPKVVAPLVVTTTSLPSGATGVAYAASVAADGGVAPYTFAVSGLPAGLSADGANIAGTPSVAGSFPVLVDVTDADGRTATTTLTLTVQQSGNYTVKDESQGKITYVDPGYRYLMVGSRKLVWDAGTTIVVNTPDGERHVVDSFVKVGMRAQWKGLRDRATNTVLTRYLEIN